MKNTKKSLIATFSLCAIACGAFAVSTAKMESVSALDDSSPIAERLTNADYLAANFDLRGMSVRLKDNTFSAGKRHHLSMSNALYTELTGMSDVTVGMLLLPQSLLTDGSLDIGDAGLENAVVYDATKDGFAPLEDSTTMMESVVCLTDIPDTDFNVNIAVRGYIKIGNDYYYTNATQARSMSWVAKQEYDNVNSKFDASQKQSLKETYLDYTVSFDGTAETDPAVYGEKLTEKSFTADEGYYFKGWYTENKQNKWDFASTTVVGDVKLYSVQMDATFVEDFAEGYSKNVNFMANDKSAVNATAAWHETFENRSGVIATKGETGTTTTSVYLKSAYTAEDLKAKFDSYDWGGLTISAYIAADGEYTVGFGNNLEGTALTQTVTGNQWTDLTITRNTARNKALYNALSADNAAKDALFTVEKLPADTLIYIDSISFAEKAESTPAANVLQSFDGYSAGFRKTDDYFMDTDTVQYLDTWDGRTGVAREYGADKYGNYYPASSWTYDEIIAIENLEDVNYFSIWIWIDDPNETNSTVTLQNNGSKWKNVPRQEWYELRMYASLFPTDTANKNGKYNYTLDQFYHSLGSINQNLQYLFWSSDLVTDDVPDTYVYFDDLTFVMYDTSRTIQNFDNTTPSVVEKNYSARTQQSTLQYHATWEGRTGVVSDLSWDGNDYGNFYVASSSSLSELKYKSQVNEWDYISLWIWIDYDSATNKKAITLQNGSKKFSVVGQSWQELRFWKDEFKDGTTGTLQYTLENFLIYIQSDPGSVEYLFYSETLAYSGGVRVYFDNMSFEKQTAQTMIQDFSKPTTFVEIAAAQKLYQAKTDKAGVEYLDSLTDKNNVTKYGVAGSYATGQYGNVYVTGSQTYEDMVYSSNNLDWDYISIWAYIDCPESETITLQNKSKKFKVTGNTWTEIKFNKSDFSPENDNTNGYLMYTLDNFLHYFAVTPGYCQYFFFSDALMNAVTDGDTTTYEGKYKIYFDEMSFHVANAQA